MSSTSPFAEQQNDEENESATVVVTSADDLRTALLSDEQFEKERELNEENEKAREKEKEQDNISSGDLNDSIFSRIWKTLFKGNQKVAVYSLLLLIASVGNSIFFKRMSTALFNYPFFLSEFTTLVYVPVFLFIVLYEWKFTDRVTPETLAFPIWKFAVMGAFDSLAGICMLFGSVHTAGGTQALLNNATIPAVMVCSIIILRVKYKWNQYLGALIILGGVSVALVPNLISGDNSGDVPIFNIIFVSFVVPQALSSVYKEIAFAGSGSSEDDINVNYLQGWVAFFQLIFGFALLPLNTLDFLGSQKLNWADLPSSMANGLSCLVGVNSIVNSTDNVCIDDTTQSDIQVCDACAMSWLPTFLYMCFNIAFNIFITLLLKYGNASLLFIVLTVRLPLTTMAFWIPGVQDPPDSFSYYAIIGLIVILCGLVLYRWQTKAADTAPAAQSNGAAADADKSKDESGDGHSVTAVSIETLTEPSIEEFDPSVGALGGSLASSSSSAMIHGKTHEEQQLPRKTSEVQINSLAVVQSNGHQLTPPASAQSGSESPSPQPWTGAASDSGGIQ